MPGPIILVLDGTAKGELAVPFAIALAQQAHTELHVTQVESPTLNQSAGDGDRAADYEQCERRLRMLLERFAWAGTAARAVCLDGEPTTELLKYCEREDACLIVAVAQTPPTLRLVFSEQIADAVIRFAQVPVVVYSPSTFTRPQPHRLDRVLVALDGSPAAEHALEAVRTFTPDAEIILMQAICSSDVIVDDQPLASAIPIYLANERRNALEYLNGIAEDMRASASRVTVAIAEGTWPGDTIVKESIQREVGLLALATHGRTGFSRRALGSCAAEVLRLAPMPVLIAGPSLIAPRTTVALPAREKADVA